MTALSFVWVHPYSQNSRCDNKKGEIFNISDLVSNRLRTLEAKFSSLIGPGSANILTGTELTLPSTSTRPTPPPRRDSVPMLDMNITPQAIQETVKDMERQGSKIRRFQKDLETNHRRPRVTNVQNFT